MRNIKLTLEYDGLRFFGFQKQKAEPTIQNELERALSKLFNRTIKITAASGRTDSGAHAKGQVVNFKTDSTLPLKSIQKGLNALLPKEIVVKKVQEVPLDFHARYGAKSKTYKYLVFNSKIRSPLLNGRAYQYPYLVDVSKMRKAAQNLVGRHDFKCFQATGSSAKSSIRTIRRFTIFKKGRLLRFIVEADGFLYHMVRNLVGALLDVGRGSLSLHALSQSLSSKKQLAALRFTTAPAHALTLDNVRYE